MTDIYCDVIDNFGDIAFAIKAINTYSFDKKENNFRFYSNNKELFDVFSESLISGITIEYFDLGDIKNHTPSTLILNFFERKIDYKYLESFDFEIKLINFSYFSLESFKSVSAPGIVQNHGKISKNKNFSVEEFSVSLLKNTGGVFSEKNFIDKVFSKEYFENTYKIPKNKKWISVFCYPETQKQLESEGFFEDFGEEFIFLSFGKQVLGTQKNLVLPFLTLQEYYSLLQQCHSNMVRGENSLITAIEAKKPFYWDIYKESNKAHKQKLEDFEQYLKSENYPEKLIQAQTAGNIDQDFNGLQELFSE